jgi:hypothetical protein
MESNLPLNGSIDQRDINLTSWPHFSQMMLLDLANQPHGAELPGRSRRNITWITQNATR